MSTESPVLRVRGLSATAGSAVLLDDVSFEAEAGRVTVLAGPSGSGKTSAALALLGASGHGVRLRGQVEVAGTAVVDENGVTADAERVRGAVVAYLPQHPGSALNPARRIGSTLTELARLHGHGEPEPVVAEALRAAQLPDGRELRRRFPHQFSGGQRQRVALAQTMACRPRVLVLDEPSTGLDPATAAKLAAELTELAGAGLAVLLLSHDQALVRALADRVVLLRDGRVVRSGPPAEVLPALEPYRIAPLVSEVDTPLLEVRSLSATLRRGGRAPVLHDVHLTVPKAGCVGVAGPSGSGKTTLARCVAGLHERYRGRILLDGEPLPVLRRRDPVRKRRVQYVWQEVRGSFDERRTVLDQVARTAVRLGGSTPADARAQAVATLERLGVGEGVSARRPASLSGGELQRAALARAVLAGPDLLICDEITTSLDRAATESVLALLAGLHAERGLALLWVSHDAGLLGAVAQHVVELVDGRVADRPQPVHR
ncbi:ABC transporter ATP-binding protein [Amycolatopsis nigrescens]|uniref:ABC transporter ATP-binding protein n=1 Tax=Amycolatopsis nigrescens TaxID=381445 RepID=UPI0012FAD7E3|nr:ATP-binding cassette domain-containing protein [Amycolatopsis nigrescens]